MKSGIGLEKMKFKLNYYFPKNFETKIMKLKINYLVNKFI